MWIWGYGFVTASVVVMVGILCSLIVIYYRVDVNYAKFGRFPVIEDADVKGWKRSALATFQFWIFQIPFSLYLAWISVATIANVAAAISTPDFTMRTELATREAWSAAMQTVATLLALFMLVFRRDVFFGGVVTWALFAIRSKHMESAVVSTAATVLASLLLTCSVFTLACNCRDYFNYRRALQNEGNSDERKPIHNSV